MNYKPSEDCLTKTDWFRDSRIGAFMHFLPGDTDGATMVERFDVNALAEQLERMGAKYFIFTLGQNSGYFNAPNAVYDRITGYKPGERCAKRDLPLELFRSLSVKGIRLMLYLPCQTPNRDPKVQRAFGLSQGPKDQPISPAFAELWAEVIREWSKRYGDKVSGWWFDGGYEHIHFSEEIACIYADAVKCGNANAIVTFNPGVKLIRYTQAEDYTAGELADPFDVVPTSRWLNGSQWHVLTYMGKTWGARDVRYSTELWCQWALKVMSREGVITLDVGPGMNPEIPPIGSIDNKQAEQFRSIAQHIESAEQ